MSYNTEEIRHAYKSKYNLKCKNQVIFMMNREGKKWHYLAEKSLSALSRGITSNHNVKSMLETFIVSITFICIEQKMKKYYNVCKNHDYCYVEMP